MSVRARGHVVRREGETVWIRICQGEHCGHCSAGTHSTRPTEVQVQDSLGVQPGQHVEIEVETMPMLRALLLVFWMPLLVAGVGALAGSSLGETGVMSHVAGAWLGGVAGFLTAVLLVWRAEKRTRAGAGLRILRIIPAAEA
jgi:positive regulator of sigma E activity